MGLFNKKELERIEELERLVSELKGENEKLNNRNKEYEGIFGSLEEIEMQVDNKRNELLAMNNEMEKLEEQINEHNNMAFLIDTNLYANPYTYSDSKEYKEELDKIKREQREWLKDGKAWEEHGTWKVNQRVDLSINASIILAFRAFNNECDNIIMNVRYSNIGTCEKKIRKSFKDINDIICSRYTSYFWSMSEEYLELKIKELMLKVGYETKKEEEKEEQRRIREIMKEEERVAKEIEEAKKSVEKDEKHVTNEISKLEKKLAKEKGDKGKGKGEISAVIDKEVDLLNIIGAIACGKVGGDVGVNGVGKLCFLRFIGTFGRAVVPQCCDRFRFVLIGCVMIVSVDVLEAEMRHSRRQGCIITCENFAVAVGNAV